MTNNSLSPSPSPSYVNFKVNLKQFVHLLNELLDSHKNSISDQATLSVALIDGSAPTSVPNSFALHPFAQLFLIAEEPNALLPDGSIIQGLRLFCLAPRDPDHNDFTPVNIDDYILEQIASYHHSHSLSHDSSPSPSHDSTLSPKDTQPLNLDIDTSSLVALPQHFNCC